MKAPPFSYERPATVADCLALLARHGDDAQILAGGQSLVPMLNLRLARPAVLIDINRLAELAGIDMIDGALRIGALTRHRAIETSELVAGRAPLLARSAPYIAHIAIRTRGTLGGSLALADPAAEWPLCALVLGAEIELQSAARGTRRVAAVDFFQGIYTTARQSDELLVRVVFPGVQGRDVHVFDEVARRHGDFALVSIALTAVRRDAGLSQVRLGFGGVHDRPLLATRAMAALEGRALDDRTIRDAVEALQQEITPLEDPAIPAAYRRHVSGVLLQRSLRTLAMGRSDG